MTISTLFNTELQLVDAGKTFTYTSGAGGYGINEWSVAGFAVTGGSDAACEHGAGEALHAMGYRFWTPTKITRPGSIPSGGVTLPKQQFAYPYSQMFVNYGFGGNDGPAGFNVWRDWAIRNNAHDSRRPVGHMWGTIINAINAQDGWFTANPTYTVFHGGTGTNPGNLTFDLSTSDKRSAIRNKIVPWLTANLNEFDRISFDPVDGSQYSSDVVFGFANDVVADIREVNANAMLGVYAYAGHRAPVVFDCPNIYVQVALGFNNLGIGYTALVEQWGARASEVALRGYGDIAAQQGYLPMNSTITRRNAFENATFNYASYRAAGANGVKMETSANWTKNVVSHYRTLRYWKDGAYTYDDALNEALPILYDNDSAVADLFNFWGNPASRFSAQSVRQSCTIIDAMADSEYRDEFRRYMTFVMQHLGLDDVPIHSGPYFTRLEKNLRWSRGMRDPWELHHYAYARQLANSNVKNHGRSDLAFDANPHWDRYPAISTDQDYLDLRDGLAVDVSENVAYDSASDLVLVDVMPTGSAASTLVGATTYHTVGSAFFVFVGPGTVTVDYDAAWLGTQVLEFGEGMHNVEVDVEAVTSFSGGLLFLRMFPGVRMDPDQVNGGSRWAYVPRRVQGRIRLSSDSRIRLFDHVGQKNIRENLPPFTQGMVSPQTLVPGVCRVDNVNTRGIHTFGNINPFLSPSPFTQLMPKARAEAEMLGRTVIMPPLAR